MQFHTWFLCFNTRGYSTAVVTVRVAAIGIFRTSIKSSDTFINIWSQELWFIFIAYRPGIMLVLWLAQRSKAPLQRILRKPLSAIYYTVVVVYCSYTLGHNCHTTEAVLYPWIQAVWHHSTSHLDHSLRPYKITNLILIHHFPKSWGGRRHSIFIFYLLIDTSLANSWSAT